MSKLIKIVVLISKVLIDSPFIHDAFVSINVLKAYNDMKEEIKNLTTYSSLSNILVYL